MDNENKILKKFWQTQKLGYAESNPSADLNGDDVSSKLKILSSMFQFFIKQ